MNSSFIKTTLILGIAVLGLAASPVAQARSIDPTKVVANLKGPEGDIEEVTLLEDGRMFIQKTDGSHYAKRLSSSVRDILVDAAQTISGQKLVKKTSLAVCTVMPARKLQMLYITGYSQSSGFTGKSRYTLSPDGCWVSTRVRPQEDWANELAQELRAQLRVLALDTVQ